MNELEQHTYHLEKYHGIGSRHKCPECGDKSSFSYYVDEDGEPIDASVGRCNHESSCGYHYTPKQFYADNKIYQRVQPHQKGVGGTDAINHGTELPPSYIDKDYVYRSLHHSPHPSAYSKQ